MDAAALLTSLDDQAPAWASASNLACGWELKQLADRLAEKAGLLVGNVTVGWILVIRRWAGDGRSAQIAVIPQSSANDSTRPKAAIRIEPNHTNLGDVMLPRPLPPPVCDRLDELPLVAE